MNPGEKRSAASESGGRRSSVARRSGQSSEQNTGLDSRRTETVGLAPAACPSTATEEPGACKASLEAGRGSIRKDGLTPGSDAASVCECGHTEAQHNLAHDRWPCQATIYTEARIGAGSAYQCRCGGYNEAAPEGAASTATGGESLSGFSLGRDLENPPSAPVGGGAYLALGLRDESLALGDSPWLAVPDFHQPVEGAHVLGRSVAQDDALDHLHHWPDLALEHRLSKPARLLKTVTKVAALPLRYVHLNLLNREP